MEAEVPGKGREKTGGKRWGRKRKRYIWRGGGVERERNQEREGSECGEAGKAEGSG